MALVEANTVTQLIPEAMPSLSVFVPIRTPNGVEQATQMSCQILRPLLSGIKALRGKDWPGLLGLGRLPGATICLFMYCIIILFFFFFGGGGGLLNPAKQLNPATHKVVDPKPDACCRPSCVWSCFDFYPNDRPLSRQSRGGISGMNVLRVASWCLGLAQL